MVEFLHDKILNDIYFILLYNIQSFGHIFSLAMMPSTLACFLLLIMPNQIQMMVI